MLKPSLMDENEAQSFPGLAWTFTEGEDHF